MMDAAMPAVCPTPAEAAIDRIVSVEADVMLTSLAANTLAFAPM